MTGRRLTSPPPKREIMKRLEDIAAAAPRVGVLLSPDAATVRGQLASIGFAPQDDIASADWIVTDSVDGPTGVKVPVLHIEGKVSIYNLKQAIIALFGDQGK